VDNPAYSTPRGLLHAAGKTFYSGIRMYTKRKRANSGWKVAKRPRKGFPSVFRASRQRNGYGNVTAQHDSKGVYFRRRMPARKRRRWKRFSKKVNFVLNKSLGTCAFVRAVALSRSADFISTQVLGCAMSMSGYGSGSDLSDDQIVLLKDAAQRTLGDAQYYYQQVIRVSSVVMDVTFESSAFYPTGADPVVENPTDMEVDVYEIQCIRDVYVSDASQSQRDIYDFIINCTNAQPPPTTNDEEITPIGSALTSTDMGWTPWQSSKFCRYFKILKKTKKYLTPGGFFTYQLRNAKERIVSGISFDVATNGGGVSTSTQPLCNKLTKLLLFVCKGEPLTNSLGTSFWSIPRFTLGITKTFNYRIMEKNDNVGYRH
jgi:hypothetical protein